MNWGRIEYTIFLFIYTYTVSTYCVVTYRRAVDILKKTLLSLKLRTIILFFRQLIYWKSNTIIEHDGLQQDIQLLQWSTVENDGKPNVRNGIKVLPQRLYALISCSGFRSVWRHGWYVGCNLNGIDIPFVHFSVAIYVQRIFSKFTIERYLLGSILWCACSPYACTTPSKSNDELLGPPAMGTYRRRKSKLPGPENVVGGRVQILVRGERESRPSNPRARTRSEDRGGLTWT
jgi:hypothetical protein